MRNFINFLKFIVFTIDIFVIILISMIIELMNPKGVFGYIFCLGYVICLVVANIKKDLVNIIIDRENSERGE